MVVGLFSQMVMRVTFAEQTVPSSQLGPAVHSAFPGCWRLGTAANWSGAQTQSPKIPANQSCRSLARFPWRHWECYSLHYACVSDEWHFLAEHWDLCLWAGWWTNWCIVRVKDMTAKSGWARSNLVAILCVTCECKYFMWKRRSEDGIDHFKLMAIVHCWIIHRNENCGPVNLRVLLQNDMPSNTSFHISRRRLHIYQVIIWARIHLLSPIIPELLPPIPEICNQCHLLWVPTLLSANSRRHIPTKEMGNTGFTLPWKGLRVSINVYVLNHLCPCRQLGKSGRNSAALGLNWKAPSSLLAPVPPIPVASQI